MKTESHIPEDWPVSDPMVTNHHPNLVPVSPFYVDDHLFHSTVRRDQSPGNKRKTYIYTGTPLMK
jgi:hypothetical protein